MKKLIFILLVYPLTTAAQEPKPVYTNDTLYTTCGYTIYVGRKLQFAKGTGKHGKFRFISIKNGIPAASLVNNSIIVSGMKNFKLAAPGEATIDITGAIVFKDGTKGSIELHISFDRAIENIPALPTELEVPASFRNSSKVLLVQELNKLLKLYAIGAINKTDYEAQKKSLLQRQ